MKKTFLLLFTALAFMACGGSSQSNDESEEAQEYSVEVTSPKINGPLGQYFEVEARTYKIKNDFMKEVYFEVKRIADGLPAPWTEGMTTDNYDIELEINAQFMDEDGSVLCKKSLSIDSEELMSLGVDESAQFEAFIDREVYDKVSTVKFGSSFKVSPAKPDNTTASVSDSDDDDVDVDKAIDNATKSMKAMTEMLDAYSEAAKAVSNMGK